MTAAAHPGQDQPWTTRRLLAWTSDYLERKAVDSPRLAAEMLLAHVLEVPRIKLYMDMDRPASPLERSAYRCLVERAAAHEPVQYLVGQTSFFSLDFVVTPDVLIPRPSTETLVEHIIQRVKRTPGLAAPVIADVGTGSGCIAIALARHLPQATIDAVDISPAALAVARANAERLAPGRITFHQGNLLQPISHRPHLIIANLPYITDAEWTQLDDGVKSHEPTLALRGGRDGLALIRELLGQAVDKLSPNGAIFLEIGWRQGTAVHTLAREYFPNMAVSLHTDFAGHDRLVVIAHHS